ncbi:hypothetical protein VN97_g9138 [Penicillium thymicola]|uniref:Uncharacterized protein n=1 Tax=Penicillium thymicola TaxID=293382 RepID=A0AAI9TBT5_PENTH|nr:hypothetical protein VN97_g9138 [Penicillium thymicola]
MELHDSWENGIIRPVIIDREEVPYLPNLYSSCLPAPATAAPASATPALALPALTKPPHWPAPPPSSSNTTHTRPGLPLLSN